MVSDIQVWMACLLTHTAFVTKHRQSLPYNLAGFPSSRQEGARDLSPVPAKVFWKASGEDAAGGPGGAGVGTAQQHGEQRGGT